MRTIAGLPSLRNGIGGKKPMPVQGPDDPRFRGDGPIKPFTVTGNYPVRLFKGISPIGRRGITNG